MVSNAQERLNKRWANKSKAAKKYKKFFPVIIIKHDSGISALVNFKNLKKSTRV